MRKQRKRTDHLKSRKGTLNKALIERCSPSMLQLIKEAGGVHALASSVGMWHTSLYRWLSGRSSPKPESAVYRALSLLVVEKTGLTLEEALGFYSPDEKNERLDSMPENSLTYTFDEDALIAKIDVEMALSRLANTKPRQAEAIRRYHGICVNQEDYIQIAKRWGTTPERVRQVAYEGHKMLAVKLKSYSR